jgi:hypothetical protein
MLTWSIPGVSVVVVMAVGPGLTRLAWSTLEGLAGTTTATSPDLFVVGSPLLRVDRRRSVTSRTVRDPD